MERFIQYIRRKEIPPNTPKLTCGLLYSNHKLRTECIKNGMWAIVDKKWTKILAEYIGSRKVLEIMAGAGWLAKALSEFGVDILATDDFSWTVHQHKNMELVHKVENIECIKAVTEIQADILLVSWPPHDDQTITGACKIWGKKNKPIIYIGEINGCCAPDSFFKHFNQIDHPHVPLPRWFGIYDQVMIGTWKNRNKRKKP